MRMLIPSKENLFFITLLLALLLYSCREDVEVYSDYLSRGQSLVDTDPKKALITLDSISNPEEMDRDSYMNYIVTYVQAKFKAGQDISKDTLVFSARRYFENRGDVEKIAQANFYSGHIYFQQNNAQDKALEYFTLAEEWALKANNYKLAGRILNNIGYIYFDQDVMDSAIIYFDRALEVYEKEKDSDIYKLQALTNLGRAYDDIGDMNNARFYFSKALMLAEQTNSPHLATSFHNLGVVLQELGDYSNASRHLHQALALNTLQQDSLKSYIQLLKLYARTNRMDSAGYYKREIEQRIPEISDYYALRHTYNVLSVYNERVGNLKEALRYSELERSTDQKITERNNAQKLFETNTRIYMERKQKEIEKAESRSDIYLLGVLVVAIVFVIAVVLIIRSMRKNYLKGLEDVDAMKAQFRKKMENLFLLQNTYLDAVMNLVAADKEVRLLESGEKEKAEVYEKTRKMVSDAKQKNRVQLIEWAKDYLKMQPFMNKISLKLTDDDCLLLALCGYRYNGKEIAVIMGIPQDIMYLRKLELRNMFEIGGFDDDEIEDILYLEDKTILW
ncbi:tetratricopeptide repeat protein [Dysgonomonas sp. OttesenSCG-928-M03]|nr:tetratricopeptide repeat protein [Dysgonomonas sp. OttesenSCG-928-M03]